MANSEIYSVKRIDDFDINRRPFLSAIYGKNLDDVYIDSDLRRCDFREILYRSLHRQGYKAVFYSKDPAYNFYSYGQEDLAVLFNLRPQTAPDNSSTDQPVPETQQSSATSNSRGRSKYTAGISSPFGRRRPGPGASTPSSSGSKQPAPAAGSQPQQQYDQIQTQGLPGQGAMYYRIQRTQDPFAVIMGFVRMHPQTKMAVIFNTATVDEFEERNQRGEVVLSHSDIIGRLSNIRQEYATHRYKLKIVAVYGTAVDSIFHGSGFFCDRYFQDTIIGTTELAKAGSSKVHAYNVPSPDFYEYRNLLNRQRLLQRLPMLLQDPGIEKRARALSQKTNDSKNDKEKIDHERMASLDSMPKFQFEKHILGLSINNGEEQLNKRLGMKQIAQQFYELIDSYEASKNSPSPRRPHMALMGSPGTGKTTVARLFAEIMRERGILERGHLIQASSQDMIAEYVGQTRVKTQALCDRAKGGVLFIDEAYGLMTTRGDGSGGGDFGAEAIDVLIQFMENNLDSIVILAGYQKEIEDLLKNGNPGLMSRIPETGRFYFPDYDPDTLYKIFKLQFRDEKFTTEFERDMQMLIHVMYDRRDISWGNARTMENLAEDIKSQHNKNKTEGPYVPEDIPAKKRLLIATEIDTSDIFKEINKLVGLGKVKHQLKRILSKALADRITAKVMQCAETARPELNFLFLGNPGTGKTTVANMLARILHAGGLISTDQVEMRTIGDLVSSHPGQTAKNVEKLFREHGGKVLFLDEAYELAEQGREAIQPLTALLTDPRYQGTQALVLAGYTGQMHHMLSLNSGLKSRFTYEFEFEDYTDDELLQILQDNMRRHKPAQQFSDERLCQALAIDWFQQTRRSVAKQDFGNARLCGNKGLLNILLGIRAERLLDSPNRTAEFLTTIVPEDFPNYASYMQRVHSGNMPKAQDEINNENN